MVIMFYPERIEGLKTTMGKVTDISTSPLKTHGPQSRGRNF
jgi:hypothetical protein